MVCRLRRNDWVWTTSVGERQRVEIVRCLLQNPKLLIMDEPTSVLTPQAVEKLFVTLHQLASEGCSILYISHKLDEIQSLCDSATVLRRRCIGRMPKEETVETMAQLMIGRALPQYEHALRTKPAIFDCKSATYPCRPTIVRCRFIRGQPVRARR